MRILLAAGIITTVLGGAARAGTTTTFSYTGLALTDTSCSASCAFTRIRVSFSVPGSFAGGEAQICPTVSGSCVTPISVSYHDGVFGLSAPGTGATMSCNIVVTAGNRVSSADCELDYASANQRFSAFFGTIGTPDQVSGTRRGASLAASAAGPRPLPGGGWRVTTVTSASQPDGALRSGLRH